MTSCSTDRCREVAIRLLRLHLDGVHAADLTLGVRNALSLTYVAGWLGNPSGFPVSMTMPLRERPYGDAVVAPFVAGLLPDSRIHRRSLAAAFGISHDSDFSLLNAIGLECAGAVSLLPPGLPAPDPDAEPEYEVLADADLAALIRALPQRPLFVEGGDLRLSLAGVNDKAGVIRVRDGVALPRGGTPSTHILKVDIPRLPDSARVESYCLKLALDVGIQAAKSAVREAEGIPYVLVSRYDRVLADTRAGKRLRRVHQEDFCQATGGGPEAKYQREGGPGWKEAFQLMDRMTNVSADRGELLQRVYLTYLIGNPDAHGKNYSILFKNGRLSLAKAYDINNAAAFRDCFKAVRPRMAMAIGTCFDPLAVTGKDWDSFARACGFTPARVRLGLVELAGRLSEAAPRVAAALRETVEWSDRIGLAVVDIVERCAAVPTMLAATEPLSGTKEEPDGDAADQHVFSGP